MKREILISATQREVRVAILEDDQLVELQVDRPEARRMVGDIYWGKVDAVLPGIQVYESYGRKYTDPLPNSHILGYVGKVSPEDLGKNSALSLQDEVGKDGIESLHDSTLRGSGGKKSLRSIHRAGKRALK